MPGPGAFCVSRAREPPLEDPSALFEARIANVEAGISRAEGNRAWPPAACGLTEDQDGIRVKSRAAMRKTPTPDPDPAGPPTNAEPATPGASASADHPTPTGGDAGAPTDEEPRPVSGVAAGRGRAQRLGSAAAPVDRPHDHRADEIHAARRGAAAGRRAPAVHAAADPRALRPPEPIDDPPARQVCWRRAICTCPRPN